MNDFESTEARCYARSTEAHNTISVADQEQSGIMGAVQVGRKARSVQVDMELKGGVVIEASHDGYAQSEFYVGRDTMIVSDSLTGDRKHLIKSSIHLHPEFYVQLDKNILSIKKHHQAIALIEISSEVDISVKKGKYFPELGSV